MREGKKVSIMQSGVRGKGAHEGKGTKAIFKETANEGGETVEALKAQETKEHPAQSGRKKMENQVSISSFERSGPRFVYRGGGSGGFWEKMA